jgi:hypothetical protein
MEQSIHVSYSNTRYRTELPGLIIRMGKLMVSYRSNVQFTSTFAHRGPNFFHTIICMSLFISTVIWDALGGLPNPKATLETPTPHGVHPRWVTFSFHSTLTKVECPFIFSRWPMWGATFLCASLSVVNFCSAKHIVLTSYKKNNLSHSLPCNI